MKSASTISLVAVLALASQAVAEPLGTGNVLMSTRDLFTLKGRSNEGYKSKVAVCGLGADCSSVSFTRPSILKSALVKLTLQSTVRLYL